MSCFPREGANTAQSSPIPNGARGEAAPSHWRIARISFSSPHAETDSCGRFANGCTASGPHSGKNQHDRVKIEERVRHNWGSDISRPLVRQGEHDREHDERNEA